MVIKKVTVKFDSCAECPVFRYVGCSVAGDEPTGEIPGNCPIETSAMMNRYTEFSSSRSSSSGNDLQEFQEVVEKRKPHEIGMIELTPMAGKGDKNGN